MSMVSLSVLSMMKVNLSRERRLLLAWCPVCLMLIVTQIFGHQWVPHIG